MTDFSWDFPYSSRRMPVLADNVVCTSQPLAAQAGLRMLLKGGNAVDAAIAGGILLGICEPQMTGIGGDCFILLKTQNSKKIVALNGSGKSPKNLTAEKLTSKGLSIVPDNSVDSVTIPGAIDAFCRLSEDYGKAFP